MSGRVHTVLPNGRRVVGYRKTLRRNPRRVIVRAGPFEHRLIFQLPKEINWTVPPGLHGPSIEIGTLNNVTVRTFDRDFTFRTAAEFLSVVGKGHDNLHVSAVLQSMKGHATVQLVLIRGNVIVFYRHQHMVFPGKR